MAQLLVTCPECGLCREIKDREQGLDDPDGECKHHIKPAQCPALRAPLIAASRMLDLLEWETLLADESLQPSPSIVAGQEIPEPVQQDRYLRQP